VADKNRSPRCVLASQLLVGLTRSRCGRRWFAERARSVFVSRPTDIAQRIGRWIGSGMILGHLAVTLEESLMGLSRARRSARL